MSTTTNTTPLGEPQSKNRPPADTLINEVFFDKKCAKKEPDHKKFYTWCASAGPSIETTCRGIGGGEAECQFTAEFINFQDPKLATRTPNGTTTDLLPESTASVRFFTERNGTYELSNGTTTTMAPNTDNGPEKLPEIKEGNYSLHYTHKCDMGGKDHMTYWDDTIAMNKSIFDDVTANCYQELYGKPFGMPWWLIVLIILIVLAAVGAAFTLFWRYWLRQRVYGSKRRDNLSRYTSAPFSSASSKGANRASGIRSSRSGSSRPSKISSTSRLPSSSASKLPSGSQAQGVYRAPSASRQGTSGLSSSRSSTARQPSRRSSLSKP